MREASCRDGRGRQHRDDDPRHRRIDAPAVDEEQDEQEEGRREGAGDQEEREVGGYVGSTRRAADRVGVEPDQSDQGEEGEWRLDEEDRLPAESLGEDPARRRAERRPDDPRGGPRAHRARVRAVDRSQQVERRAHEERAADRLHAPRADEDAE